MKKSISNKTLEALAERAIYKSAEEENIELGVALKNISENKLKEITGRSLARKPVMRRWIWPAISIAAVVGLVLVCVVMLNFQSKNEREFALAQERYEDALDNTLVAYNYVPAFSKDGEELVDISAMNENELKEHLPILQKAYEEAPEDDIQESEDSGMRLAMAYLMLHDREKAVNLLNELKSRFDFDEEYVAKCNKIISLLK